MLLAPSLSLVSGSWLDHRSHPALARWTTMWIPSTSMSMNLPWRLTPLIARPDKAETGGSNVLRTANDASSMPTTTAPAVSLSRNSTSALTSGSSGMGQ
jgi:hypothetical protein